MEEEAGPATRTPEQHHDPGNLVGGKFERLQIQKTKYIFELGSGPPQNIVYIGMHD